jgi:HEPN domain-containing protein
LPTPEHLEVARLLLEKAAGDLAALKVLAGDDNQADHVVGLLAQQTVEKSIKAVLASREVEIPRTHDLGYLTKLCAGHRSLPEDVAASQWLTPWAGGWRYDIEGAVGSNARSRRR